jgi:hypothetical protein
MKKHGKTSVKVAARTSQADPVQYKNNEQYNTQPERILWRKVDLPDTRECSEKT